MTATENDPAGEPFNGPLEIGLRALTTLTSLYPEPASLQRLIMFDYFVVHSDDLPEGPPGLHPKTPYRSGELLVRRGVLQEGLSLYASRGLISREHIAAGIFYSATELSAQFLDSLQSAYIAALRERAEWLIRRFAGRSDAEIEAIANAHLGDWGAEFVLQSVLWEEGDR